LFGPVKLECSYYHCAACRSSQQPWDDALRLGKRRITPAAEEAISLAGVLTSFGRASRQTLHKLTGIRVSESTVLRVTEDAGARLNEQLNDKQVFGADADWQWQRDAQGKTCGYVSLDHVSVPQQGPRGARAESRMAAVALVYNPQSKHDERLPRGHDDVRFISGFYAFDALGLQLRRQAAQVGWDDLGQQLAISDAGMGLEDFARKNFPLATRMLDFYHASQHAASLAEAMHPNDVAARERQRDAWCHKLKHEGGAALRREWEQIDTASWNDARRAVYESERGYYLNHEHRMDYPRYKANGWQIGSGPVESGCKRVVTQRLKGAGMRWSQRGSNALCHLQALLLSESGCWESYWNPKSHLQI
jgi:hypothetical protein